MAGGNNASNMDPYKVAWFADCAPSLLTNRTIRRFLNTYSQHTWPEVIKLTLIYGILGLEQQFPGGRLSIPQLHQLVERGGAQLVVERTLPGLQRQILSLQTNLDDVFDRLAVEPPPASTSAEVQRPGISTRSSPQRGQPQQQLAGRQPGQQQQQPQLHALEAAPSSMPPVIQPASVLNPGPVAPKPSDEWRQGDKTGFPSPPRTRDNPLRRSLDNQGATNPIYPDWWLAAGPPDPPACKHVQRKPARKQPRLAYSVQQQQPQLSAGMDDLVTPEYLAVRGRGYGQDQDQPVVAGDGPPVMVTSITAHSMRTNPLYGGSQPAAATAVAAAGRQDGADPCASGPSPAGVSDSKRHAAGKGPRAPQAVQSKVREAVAASRRKAAAQQQRRQQLLASAVAAGSSLFGPAVSQNSQQQEEEEAGPITGAELEAVAACAPAAAAEHFLSNPWTSWFLDPAAVRPDVCGFANLPAADITADDEARLAAIAEGMQPAETQTRLRAPAAYAALQSVVAAGQQAGAGLSTHVRSCLQQPVTDDPASAAHWQLQQQHDKGDGQGSLELLQSVGCTHKRSDVVPGPQAAAGSSRGVFADITSGLNSQPGEGWSHRPDPNPRAAEAMAEAAAASSSLGVSRPNKQQPTRSTAEAGDLHSSSTSGPDDWQNLPMIDESADSQQQQQQQPLQSLEQQHGRQKAWAADFGHLQSVEPPAQAPPARRNRRSAAGHKPHKRWSETWVGDYGHLQEYPRFARETAFRGQPQQCSDEEEEAGGEAGSRQAAGSSQLFMSPADLQHLVAAADQLRQQQADASPVAAVAPTCTAAALAAAAAEPGGGSTATSQVSGSHSGSYAADGSAAAAAQGLAAKRFAQLLSRWDAQAAVEAAGLPAGVAACASVSRAAAVEQAISSAAADSDAVAGCASSEAACDDFATATSSLPADSAADSSEIDRLLAGGLPTHSRAQGGSLAVDAAALLQDLQLAVSGLSSSVAVSDVGTADGSDGLTAAFRPAEPAGAPAAPAVASHSPEPVDSHLESMQEASQMLQQALGRHDALMQLIASLGPAAGSSSDMLFSSTASGSDFT